MQQYGIWLSIFHIFIKITEETFLVFLLNLYTLLAFIKVNSLSVNLTLFKGFPKTIFIAAFILYFIQLKELLEVFCPKYRPKLFCETYILTTGHLLSLMEMYILNEAQQEKNRISFYTTQFQVLLSLFYLKY